MKFAFIAKHRGVWHRHDQPCPLQDFYLGRRRFAIERIEVLELSTFGFLDRDNYSRCSGKRLGIQYEASVAGKVIRSGPFGVCDVSTPRATKSATTRFAVRSLTSSVRGTSPARYLATVEDGVEQHVRFLVQRAEHQAREGGNDASGQAAAQAGRAAR